MILPQGRTATLYDVRLQPKKVCQNHYAHQDSVNFRVFQFSNLWLPKMLRSLPELVEYRFS